MTTSVRRQEKRVTGYPEKRKGQEALCEPPAPSLRTGVVLQPVHALGGPDVDRLLHLDARHLLARLVEAQHGVVIHVEPLAVNLGLKHFRTRNDVVPEDDLLAG